MTIAATRRRKVAAAFGLALVGTLATPSLAGAQADPPVKELKPGATFTLSGADCAADDEGGQVSIYMIPAEHLDEEHAVLVSAEEKAKNDGTWSLTGTIPASTADGYYYVAPACLLPNPEDDPDYTSLVFVAKVTTASPDPTPSTGPEPVPPADPDDAADAADKKAEIKKSKPKAVKAKPAFTG